MSLKFETCFRCGRVNPEGRECACVTEARKQNANLLAGIREQCAPVMARRGVVSVDWTDQMLEAEAEQIKKQVDLAMERADAEIQQINEKKAEREALKKMLQNMRK